MRIAVFGVGGVGGYFGGRLAQAGADVTFVARGESYRVLSEQGLKVDSLAGDFVVSPVQVVTDPTAIGLVDVVILGVKTWQVSDAARAIKPIVGPDTVVLPLQNGVEAVAQLAAVLGPEPILGGLCGLMSFLVAPGHIKHAAMNPPFIQFGELDNRRTPRVERLEQLFASTKGMAVSIPADIQVALWSKFLTVVSWGTLGAITRVSVGAYLSVPETRQLFRQVAAEIVAVAQAQDVGLEMSQIETLLTTMGELPWGATTSMQRDIMEGRPSELEAQTGAVVRLGRAVNVPTPASEIIYHSLLPLELLARGQMKVPV